MNTFVTEEAVMVHKLVFCYLFKINSDNSIQISLK